MEPGNQIKGISRLVGFYMWSGASHLLHLYMFDVAPLPAPLPAHNWLKYNTKLWLLVRFEDAEQHITLS